jgi:hypothetical protein
MTCGHLKDGQCEVKADCDYTHCCRECKVGDVCKSKCQMPEE